MTREELEKLKINLPAGYRDVLATKAELSVGSIDKVLSGERKNLNVLRLAIELAKKHKEEMKQLSLEINNL